MMQQRTTTGVVTPEAVRLEFDTAGLGSRSVALTLDLLLQIAVLVLLQVAGAALLFGTFAGLPAWVGVTVVLLLAFVVFWGYPVALESLWRGRTLGKAAMGLRVVTVEGGPVRFRHAAIRAALAIVETYTLVAAPAVLSVLFSRRNQRLGDFVAGTLVLRERTGVAAPTAVTFTVPPGAEAYAATIDPAGMTARDYQTIREFLLRARELAPGVRAALAAQIAAAVARSVRHTPPEGTAPELFLHCAAARYQQRGIPDPGPQPGLAGTEAGPRAAVAGRAGTGEDGPPSQSGPSPGAEFAPPG